MDSVQNECQSKLLCLFKNCDQKSRTIDADQNIKCHRHKLSNYNHIIQHKHFKAFIQQEYSRQSIQEKQSLDSYIFILDRIQNIVQNVNKQLNYQYNMEIQEYELRINSLLEYQDKSLSLQKQSIDEVLNFKIQYNQQINIDSLQQIRDQCDELRNFSKHFQYAKYGEYLEQNFLNLRDCQVSDNEKYILTDTKQYLKFTNLTTKKSTLSFNKSESINSYITLNQYNLFMTTDSGYISCFQIKNLKLLYKFKIATGPCSLYNIKPISNAYLLGIYNHFGFMIVDLFNKKVLRNVKNKEQIHSIEFDEIQQVIILGNYEIIFFSFQGQFLFKKERAHKKPIKLGIMSNFQLLSNCVEELKIWQIDYRDKILVLKHQLTHPYLSFGAQSLIINQYIITFCKNCICILDSYLNLILTLQHNHQLRSNQKNYYLRLLYKIIDKPNLYMHQRKKQTNSPEEISKMIQKYIKQVS